MASFIERPLLLAPSAMRPQAAWETLAVRGIDRSPPATGHWLQLGLDVGVVPGLQVGIAGSEEVAPRATFDRIALRTVFGLHPDGALRFDAGNYRNDVSGSMNGSWALGIGAPIRIVALSGKLAVFTGRTVALPPIGGTLSVAFADDFLTVDLNHANVTATIGVPVQVVVEPIPGLALALRSGYRHGWGGGNFSANWIPLGTDLPLNPASRVNLI